MGLKKGVTLSLSKCGGLASAPFFDRLRMTPAFLYSNTFSFRSKRKLGILGFALMACLAACHPDAKIDGDRTAYFNVKGFFHADSARLTKRNPTVNKTVTYNGTAEKRNVHIENWGAELSLFISSDINRPAWRDSYKISTGNGITIYTAKTPELKTRKIIIKRSGDTVTLIYIYNHTKNLLYENFEELAYYPDSLYLIKKFQKVRVLGQKNYVVRGEIWK